MNNFYGRRQSFFQKKAKKTPKLNDTKPKKKIFHFKYLLFYGFVLKWVIENFIFPLPGTANVVLGVVRSSENSREWKGISQRLESAGIPYQAIDLQQLERASDLAGITILLLPNIQSLTQTQVKALENWIELGGRAIASGPLGTRSPAPVRQTLRSLLGAYWAFPLPQPSVLQTQQTCTNTQPCDTWVAQNQMVSPVSGGIVIPSGSASKTVASWNLAQNSPAVIVNERATFFGWQWGSDEVAPPDFDKAWLQAALSHYGYRFEAASKPNAPAEKQGGATPSLRTNVNSPTLPVPAPPPSTFESSDSPPPPPRSELPYFPQ